jgi:hypothetical protein
LALRDRGALVRREVAVLAAGHPDVRIRLLADELETATHNALASLAWLVHDKLRDVDTDESLPRAMEDYGEADGLRRAVIERLHARRASLRRAGPGPAPA